MQTMLMQLEVGLLHDPTQSWTEEFEVDVSENETPLIACQRVISSYNEVEIERYGEENAKRNLRKLISCRPSERKKMTVSDALKESVDHLEKYREDMTREDYIMFLNEVENHCSSVQEEIQDELDEEDEDDETMEDEEDEDDETMEDEEDEDDETMEDEEDEDEE